MHAYKRPPAVSPGAPRPLATHSLLFPGLFSLHPSRAGLVPVLFHSHIPKSSIYQSLFSVFIFLPATSFSTTKRQAITMRFSTVLAIILPAATVLAQTNHTVYVGMNDTHTFWPNSINATAGDTVQFQFLTGNHSVTQSSFATPCSELAASAMPFDSGFMPANSSANNGMVPSVTFQVNNVSAPLWFYCKQTGHCEQGMVFAINPTASKSFAAFQAAANATKTNSTSSSGSSASASGTSSSSSSSPSASTTSNSGALRIGGSAAGLLTAVGLVAGLIL